MSFPQTILVGCACAALALFAPAGAGAAEMLSYLTGVPTCTTTSAQQPNPSIPRPQLGDADSWMQQVTIPNVPSQFAHGQDINDYTTMFFRMPSNVMQTNDSTSAPKVLPAMPPTFANGQKTLAVVSTCAKDTEGAPSRDEKGPPAVTR